MRENPDQNNSAYGHFLHSASQRRNYILNTSIGCSFKYLLKLLDNINDSYLELFKRRLFWKITLQKILEIYKENEFMVSSRFQ